MDPQKDKKYLHIAKEGLKAPLPAKWKPYKNRKGDIYYINIENNEAVYEHPCDDFYRKLFKQTKAQDNNLNIDQKNKNKGKIIIKTNKEEKIINNSTIQNNNKNSSLNQIKNEYIPKNQHFELLNDSFSNHSNSFKTTERNHSESEIIVSEGEMNQIDENINENIIAYKKRKEKELEEIKKKYENEQNLKKNSLEENCKIIVKELKQKFQNISEKMKKEKEKIENSLKLKFNLEIEGKTKQEKEKFLDLKKIFMAKSEKTLKEQKTSFEEKLRNEINQKKSKIFLFKQDDEKQKIYKKKAIEQKKKFLLEKFKEEEAPVYEKEAKENLLVFQEVERDKKNKKLNEFVEKLQKEYQDSLYVIIFFNKIFKEYGIFKEIQREINDEKNKHLNKQKELKELALKKIETFKKAENEKLQNSLNQYALELKEKLKRKIENVITNKSVDIKESLHEKEMLKMITTNKNPAKKLSFYEQSSAKINPLSLLDYNEDEKSLKSEKKDTIIETNNIQIKKIRSEINDLKNIINVKKKKKKYYIFLYFVKVFTSQPTEKKRRVFSSK